MNTLIIGGSGSLGIEIIKKFINHKLLITYNNNYVEGGIKYNAINMQLDDVVHNLNEIDVAIILLADKDPTSCYNNKKYSNQLNVESVKNILTILKSHSIKPIFLSTDFIFSGKKGNYVETDKPNPILLYGYQKVKIENYIINNFEDYLIFRLSKTYDIEITSPFKPYYNWVEMFEKERNIYCATDQIFNPIWVQDAAEIILQITLKELNGIFNLAGPKSFSRFEIFKLLYNEYQNFCNSDVKLIECSFDDLSNNPEKWPLNTSMIVDKSLKRINLKLLLLEDAVQETIKRYFKLKKEKIR